MAFLSNIDESLERVLKLVNSHRSKGMEELLILAQKGNRSAILFLGLYLSEREDTVEESVKWLEMANDFESADAAWNLAMIARERGNIDEMKMWIDRAAFLGEEDAQKIKNSNYDTDVFFNDL